MAPAAVPSPAAVEGGSENRSLLLNKEDDLSILPLSSAATSLERTRSLRAELDACLLFASSLLRHPDGLSSSPSSAAAGEDGAGEGSAAMEMEGGGSGDLSSSSSLALRRLPGGVLDAWRALGRAARPLPPGGDVAGDDEEDEAAAAVIEGSGVVSVVSHQHKDDDDGYKLGRGRLANACRTAALHAALHRAAAVAKELKGREKDDDDEMRRAVKMARGGEDGSRMESHLADDDGAAAAVGAKLLDAFYGRLREVREYHARHAASATVPMDVVDTNAGSALIPGAGTAGGGRKRLRRHGDPIADGYDLASIVKDEVNKVRSGELYGAEEVFGKYLDLTGPHSLAVGMKHAFSSASKGGSGANDDAMDVDGNDAGKEDARAGVGGAVPYVDFLALLSSGLSTSIAEPSKLKDRRKYVRLLRELRSYLTGYLNRTSPFLDVDAEVIRPALTDFDKGWAATGGAAGWERRPAESVMASASVASENGGTAGANAESESAAVVGIDLSGYADASELERAVDGESLKAELARLGMKCGGTVRDRAARLFRTKDTPLDQLPAKLFVKKNKKSASSSSSTAGGTSVADDGKGGREGGAASQRLVGTNGSGGRYGGGGGSERRYDVARLEAEVSALLDQVRPALDAAARRAERRLTQTRNEREREVYEEINGTYDDEEGADAKGDGGEKKDDDDAGNSDSDEEDDAPIYNPKGVPLGWDGKPIPYWLFKLHGLNHFYPCEICGNESYRGRRNFEKHFTESKHAYGMRCLGIPNTKHFHGVTKIEDAQRLWETLRTTVEGDQFDGEREEEYEDSHGNVLTRTAYEDLARQGLL